MCFGKIKKEKGKIKMLHPKYIIGFAMNRVRRLPIMPNKPNKLTMKDIQDTAINEYNWKKGNIQYRGIK